MRFIKDFPSSEAIQLAVISSASGDWVKFSLCFTGDFLLGNKKSPSKIGQALGFLNETDQFVFGRTLEINETFSIGSDALE